MRGRPAARRPRKSLGAPVSPQSGAYAALSDLTTETLTR